MNITLVATSILSSFHNQKIRNNEFDFSKLGCYGVSKADTFVLSLNLKLC